MKQLTLFVFSTSTDFIAQVRTISTGLNSALVVQNRAEVDEAIEFLDLKSAQCVIVDQSNCSRRDVTLFCQKMRALKGFLFTPLIISDNKVSPELINLANEYGVSRVVESQDSYKSLGDSLSSIANELTRPSGLRLAFQKLSAAQRSGNFGESDRILEDCYQLYRDDTQVQVEYGNMCLRKGKIAKASQIALSLQKDSESSLRVSNFVARTKLKEGNFGAAMTVLDKANMLSPENLDRLVLMGDLARVQGKDDLAEAKYQEVLDIEPESVPGKKGMGLVALSAGDANRALDFFRGSFTEEETGSFFNNTAVLAVKRQNFEKAQNLYSAANSAFENTELKAKVAFNLGLLYRKWSKKPEAVEQFQLARQLDPDYSKPLQQLEAMGAKEQLSPSVKKSNPKVSPLNAADKDSSALGLLSSKDGLVHEQNVVSEAGEQPLDTSLDLLDFADPLMASGKITSIEDKQNDVRPLFSIQSFGNENQESVSKLKKDKSSNAKGKPAMKAKTEKKVAAPPMKMASGGESAFIDDEDDDDLF